MIDLETVEETADGTWHDRLAALLIGIIAVLAACLATVQLSASLEESRASAEASRLASDVRTKADVSFEISRASLLALQHAFAVGIEGTSRQLVGLQTDDAVGSALGVAEGNASQRLQGIAGAMGAQPDASASRLDAYVLDLLTASSSDLLAATNEQNRQVDLADHASARSGRAVLGLSAVALAGVLVGLAAVLGAGRGGRMTLALGYTAAALAGILLVAAFA